MQRLVWALFLRSAPVLRSAHIFKKGVARMNIFPSVDLPQPRDPQSRNVKMAQLLGSLIDQPQTAQAALREARTLLLQPFVQNPEPGATVYGCANSLDEKLAARSLPSFSIVGLSLSFSLSALAAASAYGVTITEEAAAAAAAMEATTCARHRRHRGRL